MKFKVIVRVRPLSQREKQTGSENVVTIEGKNNIAVTNIKVHEQNAGDSRERIRRFAFDYCFAEDATQENIFETVEQIVGASLKNGHHSCVLAYGQSSSGKTHTMMGFPHNPGLTPRLCRRIFKYFENENLNKENNNTAPMKVTVSYLEIYNEKVADLLNNDNENNNIKQLNGLSSRKSLRVREHPKKGPYVEGLSQHLVSTDQELLERLETGTNKRRVGSTITNPRSSRSHSVFSISCDGIKLHLVDLAGNERTGSRGEYHAHSRFREGANINKSLVALGNVISNLADHSKGSSSSSSSTLRNKFVPYRDSILTWLLKDTLQGNSNTVMIATVSPSSSCYSETVNTLRFGQRAKLIVYKPVIVEDSKEKTIRELKFEIARLKELLSLNNNQHYHHQMNIMSASCENDSHKEELKNASDGNNPQESTISESCSSTVSSQENLAKINSEYIMSKKLSRNFSIDTTATTDNSIKSFSSQDSLIQSPKRNATSSATTNRRLSSSGSSSGVSSAYPKPTILSLKREAISKNSAPLLKSITQKKLLSNSGNNNNNNNNNRKSEKGVVTEITGRNNNKYYQEVKNSSGKPRAQIVAAVTSRLYSKVNKKDIGISTEDLLTFNKNNAEPPKELSICSNARNRLREITKKALKAHKSKDVETQTMDLSPVMRVKEVATDCSDLDNIEEINNKEFKDAEVNCTILNDFIDAGEFLKNIFVITKSCGVQTASFAEAEKTISFRKYLINPPIYTESVNINVLHNYNNNNSPSSVETLSDDSLDNNNPSSVNNNVGFSTPDLISNHNSLENETEKKLDIQYALCNQFEENWENVDFISNCKIITNNNNNNHAKIFNLPLLKNFKEIDVICTQATEILQAFPEEKYKILPKFNAIFAKASAKIVRNTSMKNNKENVQIFQPICFQQISNNNNNNSSIIIISDDDEDSSSLTDLPSYSDSLEYHKINQNKKVKFINNNNNNNKKERKENQRMMKAMKEFLEEAQILMGNLKNTTTTTILRTECNQPHLDDFDIEVTLNEISGIEKLKNNNNNYSNNGTQTELLSAPSRASSSSQTSFIELPSSSSNYGLPLINKYDTLLEDSCRRLEEQIKKPHHHHHRSRRVSLTSEDFDEYDDRSKYYNPWDLSVEDSSLESNPITFSDYGSLPRKTYKRQRTPTCSPSAFLRQLTQMRKQIIENSQEELLLMQGSNSSN